MEELKKEFLKLFGCSIHDNCSMNDEFKEILQFISQNFVSKAEYEELHYHATRLKAYNEVLLSKKGSNLNLDELEKKIDEMLAKETSESLNEFFEKCREQTEPFDPAFFMQESDFDNALAQARKDGIEECIKVLDKVELQVLIKLNDEYLQIMSIDEYNKMINDLDEYDGIEGYIFKGYVLKQQPISIINQQLKGEQNA